MAEVLLEICFVRHFKRRSRRSTNSHVCWISRGKPLTMTELSSACGRNCPHHPQQRQLYKNQSKYNVLGLFPIVRILLMFSQLNTHKPISWDLKVHNCRNGDLNRLYHITVRFQGSVVVSEDSSGEVDSGSGAAKGANKLVVGGGSAGAGSGGSGNTGRPAAGAGDPIPWWRGLERFGSWTLPIVLCSMSLVAGIVIGKVAWRENTTLQGDGERILSVEQLMPTMPPTTTTTTVSPTTTTTTTVPPTTTTMTTTPTTTAPPTTTVPPTTTTAPPTTTTVRLRRLCRLLRLRAYDD